MHKVIIEDINSIINDSNIEWPKLNNKTILVTGATGLIGSLLVKTILFNNIENLFNTKVIALVRNKDKANQVFEEFKDDENLEYIFSDINEKIEYNKPINYIIHGASVTSSKDMVEKPVDTLFTGINGTRNMLEFSKDKKIDSMVYISSMEVYGVTNNDGLTREEDLGYIDILSVRSSYSEGKRVSELICKSYQSQYNVPVKIARLAQTFGAGVSKADNRVFGQFSKSVLSGENIVLHTKGESYGNYCYTADVIRGLLTILLKGNDGEAYTVVNEKTTMMIKNMAELVLKLFNTGSSSIVFDIPESSLKYGYAPDVKTKLSSEKIRSLGWSPVYDLDQMYIRMVESWKN